MKKTITINLSGLVFNIEEDAYQKLNEYLKSIKDHYGEKEGREIITDIESSVSEKFQKKLKKNKQVVVFEEVEEIIRVMGTVEEIGAEVEADTQVKEEQKEQEEYGVKKLYRNSDDVIVSGVCSGLAAYFGVDAVIVRIIFVVFIFLNGFGVLAYFVLWLVMPKALSRVQKLEMSGKPVNLRKLEQAVKEKSEMIRTGGKRAIKKMSKNRIIFRRIFSLPVEIAERTFTLLRRVIVGIKPVVAIFLGLVFVVVAFLTIFSLIFLVGMLFFNIDSPLLISDIPLGELSQDASFGWLLGLVFFVAGVPLVFILFLGVSLLRQKNTFNLMMSLFLIFVWFSSLAGVGIVGARLAPTVQNMVNDFENRERVSRDYDLKDYSKIRIGGEARVRVSQGEEYDLKVSNDEKSLENFEFKLEDGELILGQNRKREGICFFCFDRPYDIEITLPKLESFIAYGEVDAEVNGFLDDMRVNAGEAARVKVYFDGQNLKSYVAGTSGRVDVLGSPKKIEAVLEGHGRLDALELDAQEVDIKQGVFSRVYLGGETEVLNVEADFQARTFADDLIAQAVNVEAVDYARVETYVEKQLKAVVRDQGLVLYQGDPGVLKKVVSENGMIKKEDEFVD